MQRNADGQFEYGDFVKNCRKTLFTNYFSALEIMPLTSNLFNIQNFQYNTVIMKLSFRKTIKLILLIMTVITMCKRTEPIQTINTPEPENNSNIFIDTSVRKPISPYIYGINGVPSANVSVKAYRLGGNRTTGYNWENNLSNAGEDWHNYNDEYLVPRGKDGSIPAITVTDFVENVKRNGAYALITLPMAGYVANDNKRTVTSEETAPSNRFAKIINRKNRQLSLIPDLTDGIVYQDEFINFLINKLGKASGSGINGYSLDNEPALWPSTHPRIHTEKTTISRNTGKINFAGYGCKRF
jgi:hypothetical protein